MSAILEDAFARREELVAMIEDYDSNEPIGFPYNKEDRYRWSSELSRVWEQKNNIDMVISQILDEQMDAYFNSAVKRSEARKWDKAGSCRRLHSLLDNIESPRIGMPLRTLFVYLQNAVMYIPENQKKFVLNEFAYKLEEWSHVHRDSLRFAMSYIGHKLDERCFRCGCPLPYFCSSGMPVCDDCE